MRLESNWVVLVLKSNKGMEEWKEFTLEDICKKIIAGGDASKLNVEKNKSKIKNIPVYANSVENDGLYGFCDKASIIEPCVTVAARGAGTGFVCYRPKPFVPIVRLIVLIPNQKVLACFLSYVLKVKNLKGDGSAIPQLTVPMIKKEIIRLPNLRIQERVVSILSSLDAKIECNRKINENLEQQAQTLFKSWFVDFEPFQDGNFVESELGMIPEGWEVGLLEDFIIIKYGKDHKKLNDGNIPVYGSGGIMRYVDTFIYDKESVLIPRKGTLNNVMFVNKPFWSVDTMFYTVMKEPNVAKFVYLFLKRKDLSAMNNGSAVPSMTTNILNNLTVIVPSKKVLSDFEEIVGSIWNHHISLEQQISRLAHLRDTLLPKLMSGEITIND